MPCFESVEKLEEYGYNFLFISKQLNLLKGDLSSTIPLKNKTTTTTKNKNKNKNNQDQQAYRNKVEFTHHLTPSPALQLSISSLCSGKSYYSLQNGSKWRQKQQNRTGYSEPPEFLPALVLPTFSIATL